MAQMGLHLPSKPILLLPPPFVTQGEGEWRLCKAHLRMVRGVTVTQPTEDAKREKVLGFFFSPLLPGSRRQDSSTPAALGHFSGRDQRSQPASPPQPTPEGQTHRNPLEVLITPTSSLLIPNPGMAAASHSCYVPDTRVFLEQVNNSLRSITYSRNNKCGSGSGSDYFLYISVTHPPLGRGRGEEVTLTPS